MSRLMKIALILGLCSASFLGCAALGPVEFCLMHPEYGQVCVGRRPDGTLFVRGSFSDEDVAKIKEWASKIIK